ncbi:MAG TPA: lysophospholipid acyltransferase family protein [Caulobacteraceae bacterium]|jgi:1-acyl-sn-glycerol-3-phosphate acyltransferase|nr:lysophospholipid acyltransferase family protein [Caulobacteraceae bacterium]
MNGTDRPSAGQIGRSAVYVVWLIGLMLIEGVICLPLLLGPPSWPLGAIRLWSRLQLWGLRHIAGVRVEFRGLQYRPTGATIVASKHQAELDGFAPFAVLPDPCFVLKRELMRLPVLGWYARASGMIPIVRGGGSATVKALSAAATERLKRHPRQIVIFPEGTRKLPGAAPAYKGGVAALYRDLGLTCVPMATNSGRCWPTRGLLMRPGKVVYEFLEPIPAGLRRAEFMRLLEERIETATNALLAETR